MPEEDSTPQRRANAAFKGLKADKTANEAKRLNEARVKADSDKTARLRAARLERDASEANRPSKGGKTRRK